MAPLTRDEQARQLSDILGLPPTRALLDDVYARAEGNPFFAEELLALSGREALPVTVRDLLLARLEALSPSTRQVLRTAGVIAIPPRRVVLYWLSYICSGSTTNLVCRVRLAVHLRQTQLILSGVQVYGVDLQIEALLWSEPKPLGSTNGMANAVANLSFTFCISTLVTNSKSAPSKLTRNLTGLGDQQVLGSGRQMRAGEFRQLAHLDIALHVELNPVPVRDQRVLTGLHRGLDRSRELWMCRAWSLLPGWVYRLRVAAPNGERVPRPSIQRIRR